MLPLIQQYCETRVSEFGQIPDESAYPGRRTALQNLSEYVRKRITSGQPADLIYICTHNSRRSHFGQIWAAVAAAFYGVKHVRTWSGGTEATAFHPNAIAALQRAGFQITIDRSATDREQPAQEICNVMFDTGSDRLRCFSKVFNHHQNPPSGFAAIMTCTEAEQNCPLVPGADLRIALPYDDPKNADHTPEEALTYDTRCAQIAREALWLFSQIN